MSGRSHRLRAVQMLVLCCLLWAVSFPTTRALAFAQQALVPEAGSWFLAALLVFYRFGLAALGMLLLATGTLKNFSRLEWTQGLGLGLFGGAGILLQVDGLAHTSASISAFLTQSYVLWIPLWVALRQRRWPAGRVVVGCGLVMLGVAVLAEVDWRDFRLGRGEWETILASVFFAGQILWLERPKYAQNNVHHFSLVMFAVMALMSLPVALWTAPSAADWLRAYRTGPTWVFLGILVVCCTFGGYLLMNRWQRHVTATEAGLIYCLEPVFASASALVLPGWFSALAGIAYPNERLTLSLLVGGALITAANVLMQMPWPWPAGRAKTEIVGAAESN